jgi:hypothetical protein
VESVPRIITRQLASKSTGIRVIYVIDTRSRKEGTTRQEWNDDVFFRGETHYINLPVLISLSRLFDTMLMTLQYRVVIEKWTVLCTRHAHYHVIIVIETGHPVSKSMKRIIRHTMSKAVRFDEVDADARKFNANTDRTDYVNRPEHFDPRPDDPSAGGAADMAAMYRQPKE